MVLPNQRASQALCPLQAKKMNELRLQNANHLFNPSEDEGCNKMQALAINDRDMSGPVSMVISHHASLLIDLNRIPLAYRRKPTC